jgi:hypothetical protein
MMVSVRTLIRLVVTLILILSISISVCDAIKPSSPVNIENFSTTSTNALIPGPVVTDYSRRIAQQFDFQPPKGPQKGSYAEQAKAIDHLWLGMCLLFLVCGLP